MILIHVLYGILVLYNILIIIKASAAFDKKYFLPLIASNYPIALCYFNPKMSERLLRIYSVKYFKTSENTSEVRY